LKLGGRLVIPVGDDTQVMTVYTRISENKFDKHEFGDFKFVPMLKERN
jgi:protein-L-isoaspartate(D-aspartate) O-methyltransferase